MLIKRKILIILGWQAAVTLLISIINVTFFDRESALSSVLGGAIGLISGLAYAWRSSQTRSDTPEDLLKAQFAAERLKWGVTMALFSGVFLLDKTLRLPAFFLTYIATLLVYPAALLMD